MKTLTKLSHRILFLLFYIAMFTCTAVAQKMEISASANYGLYNYTGDGATSSGYSFGQYSTALYGNPYSTKLTSSYGLNFQGQFVYKGGFITGLQAGYDFLNSKTDVNYPVYYDYYLAAASLFASPANYYGKAETSSQFINLNPYLGYRFACKTLDVDITGGADFAFQTKNHQSVTFYNNGLIGNTSYGQNIDDLRNDIRLRGGVAIAYKKFILSLSYAYGLKNFIKADQYPLLNPATTSTGGSNSSASVHSQLIRAGIGYRFY